MQLQFPFFFDFFLLMQLQFQIFPKYLFMQLQFFFLPELILHKYSVEGYTAVNPSLRDVFLPGSSKLVSESADEVDQRTTVTSCTAEGDDWISLFIQDTSSPTDSPLQFIRVEHTAATSHVLSSWRESVKEFASSRLQFLGDSLRRFARCIFVVNYLLLLRALASSTSRGGRTCACVRVCVSVRSHRCTDVLAALSEKWIEAHGPSQRKMVFNLSSVTLDAHTATSAGSPSDIQASSVSVQRQSTLGMQPSPYEAVLVVRVGDRATRDSARCKNECPHVCCLTGDKISKLSETWSTGDVDVRRCTKNLWWLEMSGTRHVRKYGVFSYSKMQWANPDASDDGDMTWHTRRKIPNFCQKPGRTDLSNGVMTQWKKNLLDWSTSHSQARLTCNAL